MDLGERYYQLSRLGRDTFCESVAQASLLRVGSLRPGSPEFDSPGLAFGTGTGTDPQHPQFLPDSPARPTIVPLVKKLGTPFVDLVTIGRTDGNDILIEHPTISRFQAFFRRRHGHWLLCDAGSSNGTYVDGSALEPRTETEVRSRMKLRFGALEFHFHTSDSLYDVLAHRAALGTQASDWS